MSQNDPQNKMKMTIRPLNVDGDDSFRGTVSHNVESQGYVEGRYGWGCPQHYPKDNGRGSDIIASSTDTKEHVTST